MIYLFWNSMMAVIWAAATADVTIGGLFQGYVISYFLLLFMRPIIGPTRYFQKTWQLLTFTCYFVKELTKANLRVAYDVITPKLHMRPGIIAIPLDANTELEIAYLANLITLTPGTLSLAVSEDCSVLYVHAMFVDDPDALREEIKCGLERRLLEVMR